MAVYFMEKKVIELLSSIELLKENCDPISFEEGTLLKVIMKLNSMLIVTEDSKFNFTIPMTEKDIKWKFF